MSGATVTAVSEALLKTEGFEALWGLREMRPIVADKENVVITPEAFYLQGFILDFFTEYREFSVRRLQPEGSVAAYSPIRGKYYLGFIMYDGPGREEALVYLGDEKKGAVVADVDDNREYLYFLSEPYQFRRGTLITLKTTASPGTYRIEKILLLRRKPSAKGCEHSIFDPSVTVVPMLGGTKPAAVITWRTTWATTSAVEYGTSEQYGMCVKEGTPLNNHRVVLEDLEPDAVYHYRILGETREGEVVSTGDMQFTTRLEPAPEGVVDRGSVRLTVENPSDIERRAWPVTSGIPFPRGHLASAENVHVLNPEGREIPSQARVLGYWPDGSVKWLLLDFQADVAARGKETYVVEYGVNVARESFPSPLKVAETPQEITVTTGPLRFILNKEKFAFLERVWLDVNGNGQFAPDEEIGKAGGVAASQTIAGDGTLYSSLGKPSSVVVEESGPLRATIKVVGDNEAPDGKRFFAYEVRIHAYAGKPYLRVLHTFGNNVLTDTFTDVKGMYLRVPVSLGADAQYSLGGEVPIKGSLGEAEVALFQNYDDKYRMMEGERVASTGVRSRGWVDVSDGRWGLTVAVRNFWQNYPKSLAASKDGVAVGICPFLGPDEYVPDKAVEDKLYYYLLKGKYKLKQGTTRTHELFYYYHPAGVEEAASESVVALFNEPMLATAPPKWYCESKALGEIASADQKAFPQYEEAIEAGLKNYLDAREGGKEYGMLNFGDWWGERGYDWGNMEYDTPHSFLLHYMRSGDRRFFTAGEEAVRHYMDVDTVHYSSDRMRVGLVYAHCLCHVGDYYPDYYRKGAISRGGGHISHTFVEGLLDYYFLTGDERSLETARKIGDKYSSYHTRNYDFDNCRTPGWHLILEMAMYNATNDRFYLNAARIIVDRVLEKQTPGVGGWVRQMMPGHCHCIPRHRGNAGFMVGILLSGLKLYHETTGDEAVANSIVMASHFMIRDMWVPERGAFRYTSCPISDVAPGLNFLILEGIAYAYRLSGDSRFKEITLRGMEAGVSERGFGKDISMHTRFTPHTLHDLNEYMATVPCKEDSSVAYPG